MKNRVNISYSLVTVSSSPVNQHMDEPVMVNGQSSDTTDTDTGKPQWKESSPSKSNSSKDASSPKERLSSLSDPEAQPWIQVEKRQRNSSGKSKVLQFRIYTIMSISEPIAPLN